MQRRGRPKKYRTVRLDPKINQFSPRGRPGRPDEAGLTLDEFEAIRLVDLQGYSQRAAGQSMRVSQQTLSRILKRAHKTISDAIVKGKIIKIQGGPYVLTTKIHPYKRP